MKWARGLEDERLVSLQTFHGKGRMVLLPRLQPENVGLVTVWNENGAALQLWRSVIERRAPDFLPRIEAMLAPVPLGQGNTTREFSDDFLALLADAYRAAAGGSH